MNLLRISDFDIRIWFRLCGAALVSVFALASATLADEPGHSAGKKNLYLGGDFDQWDWVPISYYALPGMKVARKAGYDLSCEVRGPLYRVPLGLDTVGPCGYMVEGQDAYKGRSARFVVTDPKNPFITGQYCNGLHTDRGIGYEVAVKGKGKVSLMVWLSGFNKTTGKSAWVGFPKIFSIQATDKWELHEGTFRFPQPQDPNLTENKEVYARLVVESGSDLMVDELSVWEE